MVIIFIYSNLCKCVLECTRRVHLKNLFKCPRIKNTSFLQVYYVFISFIILYRFNKYILLFLISFYYYYYYYYLVKLKMHTNITATNKLIYTFYFNISLKFQKTLRKRYIAL